MYLIFNFIQSGLFSAMLLASELLSILVSPEENVLSIIGNKSSIYHVMVPKSMNPLGKLHNP